MASAVVGPTKAGGTPIPIAPVIVGGVDSNGNVQAMLVGADGTLTPSVSTDQTIYASAARTASPTVVDQTNASCAGIVVVINCTADPANASVVFTIQGKDNLGVLYTILESAAIVGVGTTVLRVYPNLTAAANTAAAALIPRTWNIKAVHADADSITYSVTASLIP